MAREASERLIVRSKELRRESMLLIVEIHYLTRGYGFYSETPKDCPNVGKIAKRVPAAL
jgi:hypothetical protein